MLAAGRAWGWGRVGQQLPGMGGGSWSSCSSRGGERGFTLPGSSSRMVPAPQTSQHLCHNSQGTHRDGSRGSSQELGTAEAAWPCPQGTKGVLLLLCPTLSPAGGPGQAEGFEGWDELEQGTGTHFQAAARGFCCPALPVWGVRGSGLSRNPSSGVEPAWLPWCRDTWGLWMFPNPGIWVVGTQGGTLNTRDRDTDVMSCSDSCSALCRGNHSGDGRAGRERELGSSCASAATP